jgi:RecT family
MSAQTTPTENAMNCSVKSGRTNYSAILSQAIERTAQHLNLDKDELHLWLDQHAAPLYTQLQLLRLADKYALDPLADEVGIFKHDDQSQGVYPEYAGMSLRESSELTNNIPNWMECTIYRNDRILPIIVKEYFEEVKTLHPSWAQMPRRMLRHRVIQQCARLALGISHPESFCANNSNNLEKNPTMPFSSRSSFLKNHLKNSE